MKQLMGGLIAAVMDGRLRDLLERWRAVYLPACAVADPLSAFAAHADHLLVIDTDGAQIRYRHYGRAFIEQFGVDLTGRTIDLLSAEILPVEQRGMLEFEYAVAIRNQRPLWRSYTASFGGGRTETWQRLVVPAGDGRLVAAAYRVAPGALADLPDSVGSGADLLRLVIERVPVVLDTDGRVADLALSLRTFSTTRQHVAELEVLATSDALTGVANLRHFHHLAALELEHARRMGRSFSILALDIDHFKRINDTWGHAAGDDALRAFVAACRLALREPDILGRCGGEEFAVALPNTGADGARLIAERLRRQVEMVSVPLPQGDCVRLTVSVGVATLAAAAPTGEDAALPDIAKLMAEADQALYRSKALGRNRVTMGTELATES
jgi:diguanylate cyclase (GGDEF)-like protein